MGTCLQVIHHGSNTLLERKAVKKTETARFPAVRGGATKPRGEPAPAQMTGPREAGKPSWRGRLRRPQAGEETRFCVGVASDRVAGRRTELMSAEVMQTRSSRRRPGTGDEPTGTGRAEASGGAGGPPLGPSGAWGWLFLTSNNPGLRGPAARGPRPRCVALGGTAPAWDLVSPHLTTALRGVALWLLGCGRQRAAQPLSRGPKRDGRRARRGGGGPRLSAAAEPGLRRNSVALWPPGS